MEQNRAKAWGATWMGKVTQTNFVEVLTNCSNTTVIAVHMRIAVEYEKVMRQMFVVGGDKGKPAILEEIKGICSDIDEKIGEKRNKRQRFFEYLLDRPQKDGYLIISYVESWKGDLKDQNNTALDMVLKEWDSQRDEATTHDTLYHVLCKRNEPVEYRCSALMRLSKRIRTGQDAYNRSTFEAQRMIERALDILTDHEERGEIGFAENYDSIPVEHIRLSLEYQYLFNLVRFGDMRAVVSHAKKLEAKIDKVEEFKELEWRPDIRLKWWTWQCRLRAAAFCCDTKLWIDAQQNMFNLEHQAMESGCIGIADRLREIRSEKKERTPKPRSRSMYAMRIGDFLSSWHEFVDNEDDAMVLRQLRRKRMEDEVKLRKARRINDIYTDFSERIELFLKALHTGPAGIPTTVKHSYSTTTKEKLIRSEKILAEISHAHHATVVKKHERTCFVLEILHRLLIYRLWWESLNYTGRDYEERGGYRFDVTRCCFDIAHAEDILREIEFNLEKLHTRGKSGCRQISHSIKIIHGLQSDHEEVVEKESSPSKITEELRLLLDDLNEEGSSQWDKHSSRWMNHENLFGLWFMRAGPEADSYNTPDPLMRAIGMWTIVEEEGKKPADEFNKSEKNLYEKLRIWRKEKSEAEGFSGEDLYRILWNSTLKDIVRKCPHSHSELLRCRGIGERKLDLYGDDILCIIQENSPDSG